MTTTSERKTRLITGGTGKTGRRVAHQLAARQVPVRIGSRSAEPRFDWEDQNTWEPALRDVDSAYLAYYPDLSVPGAAATVGSFAKLAATSGVRRLVLLSGRGEEQAQLAEQEVQDSGAEWTILRCSWFSQNFSESFLLDSVLGGEIVLPAGTVAEPFLDVEDIADIATEALTEDRHAGELYELTGPRLLTFATAAAEISRATERPLTYQDVSPEAYTQMLAAYDVPADTVNMLIHLFTEVLDGRNASLGDGVRRALGREPRDFADYARDAAATGVWS